jgi:hypothetical protein
MKVPSVAVFPPLLLSLLGRSSGFVVGPTQQHQTRAFTTAPLQIGGMLQGFFGKKDAPITDTVYLDVAIGGEAAGRIEIGLYGNVVPKTAQNFK